MNARVVGFVILLIGAATVVRGETPAVQFVRDIKPPSLTQEELLAVTLDSDVFADTQEGFPNLRIVETDGRPVPFVLRKVQSTTTRTVRSTLSRTPSSAKPLDGGGLEIIVQLDDKDGRPNGLRLVSPLRDFEQRVRVSTSTDGMQWEPAGEETLIFDYSRYVDVRNVDVSFPETTRRRFRIVIDDVTLEQESELLLLTRRLQGGDETERTEKTVVDRRPFRIERVDFRVEVQQERATGDAKTEYPIGRPQVTPVPEKKQTVVLIETRRQPLTSLRLVTPDRNFSRRAVVEVPRHAGSQTVWAPISEATLSRVDFKSLQREELAVSFPEARHAQYRLVIDDRDSPALAIDGIQAEGNQYESVYLAGPDKRYRMLYGPAFEPATYDTATVQELLRTGFQPKPAELGEAVQEIAPTVVRDPHWSDWLNNRPLLIAMITVLVAALGWGLFRAMKRIDTLPPSE